MDPLRIQKVGAEILFLMCPQEENFLEGAVLKYYGRSTNNSEGILSPIAGGVEVLLEVDLRCTLKFQLRPV